VAVIDLGGDGPDVAVADRARGVVDFYARGDGDRWQLEVSAFPGGNPVEIAAAQLVGRGAVIARMDDGLLTVLASGAADPRRIDIGVRVAQRQNLSAFAVGDRDGDGSDELVIAERERVVVIGGIAAAVGADPEQPPSYTQQTLKPELPVASVAVADIDGDGRAEVLALSADEPLLRIYPGAEDGELVDVALPSVAARLVSARCGDQVAIVVAEDGVASAIAAYGTLSDFAAGPVQAIASSGDALAVAAGSDIAVLDACGERVASAWDGATWRQFAIAAAPAGMQRLAVISADGTTLDIADIEF
jgi:hypothetical protein